MSSSNSADNKLRKIKLNRILSRPHTDHPLYHQSERNDWVGDKPFDDQLISACRQVLDSGKGQLELSYEARNIHRSIGTKLGIARAGSPKVRNTSTKYCDGTMMAVANRRMLGTAVSRHLERWSLASPLR